MKRRKPLKQKLQKLWDKLRRKKKLSKPLRSKHKFQALYPRFELGAHSYGVPIVKYWDDTTLLIIGKYCSIAENVQILLGGNHRVDWVSSYPFPAFFPEASHIKDYTLSYGNVVIGSDVWL